MKYPTVEQLKAAGIPEDIWYWVVDDDPTIGEVRLARYQIAAQFDFDMRRLDKSLQATTYACGHKVVSLDPNDTRGPHEVEPPDDLTGLFPDPEEFVRDVRLARKIDAKYVDDLDAFNEDGRRRAIRLGFPPDSFVIKQEEIDYRTWQEVVAELEPED